MGLQDEDEDEERGEDVDENLMRACARVWCSKTVGGSSQKHCLKRARAHQLSLAISKIAKSVGGLFKIKLGRLENDEKCRRVVQNFKPQSPRRPFAENADTTAPWCQRSPGTVCEGMAG